MTAVAMLKSIDGFLFGARPFLAMVFLQFGYAGMAIISKYALNQGMSPHVLAVYRHATATLFIAPFAFFFDRKVRPRMTFSAFVKIFFLGLLEPTIDQNLSYTGMKYTSASFASAMINLLPAFAFLLAWICRLEKVQVTKLSSQMKILGTMVVVLGAVLMTLINGPIVKLPWVRDNYHQESANGAQDPVKGAVLIITGYFCWAGFIVLQAITLRTYPAELSLTAWICFVGTLQGTVAAFAFEKGNLAAWYLRFDAKLLAAVYGGVVCSGIGYYVQGVIMKSKGPVFVTAFNPLSMLIVAIMGSFILAEVLHLGRVIGALIIVVGLYLFLWGQSKGEKPLDVSNSNKAVAGGNEREMIVVDDVSLDLESSKGRPSNGNQEVTLVEDSGTNRGVSGQEFVTLDVIRY